MFFTIPKRVQVPRATWSYSLLLSGSLLARFAAPLCYNFLHVIRMNEYLRDGQVGVDQLQCDDMGGSGSVKYRLVQENSLCQCLLLLLQQMVFIEKMGSAFADVPILGRSFNTWFPVVLIFWVLLLTLNLWESCASKFLISDAVRFDVVGRLSGPAWGVAH